MNRKGAKIRVIRQRLITPEHDQSRVTQCRVYEGIGEITVCQESVKIVTNDATRAIVLTGEGIFRQKFRTSIRDAKMIVTLTTTMIEMGSELMSISIVGPLARFPQMKSL